MIVQNRWSVSANTVYAIRLKHDFQTHIPNEEKDVSVFNFAYANDLRCAFWYLVMCWSRLKALSPEPCSARPSKARLKVGLGLGFQ